MIQGHGSSAAGWVLTSTVSSSGDPGCERPERGVRYAVRVPCQLRMAGKGGRQLVGTGFSSGKTKLTMKRDKKKDGHYTGSTNIQQDGAKGKLMVDWQVHTPERMSATNTLKLSIQGKSCTITRNFESEWVGP